MNTPELSDIPPYFAIFVVCIQLGILFQIDFLLITGQLRYTAHYVLTTSYLNSRCISKNCRKEN